MDTYSDNQFYRPQRSFLLNGELIDLQTPLVMGILNVTPDSFYDGGFYRTDKAIIQRAKQILEEGGAFIDIGAMSTRPGAKEISEQDEMERLLSAIKIIKHEFPDAKISIDTYRSSIVNLVFDTVGPVLVNDVSGGQFDSKMFAAVANLHLPYVLMHTSGKSAVMQQMTDYSDVVLELLLFFAKAVEELKLLGVSDVIIDPGFGFGKTIEQNFELLNRLNAFNVLELPIMVGLSRKAMIYKTLEISADKALNGTTALHALALSNGCNILRVHDVKEAVEVVSLFNQLQKRGI